LELKNNSNFAVEFNTFKDVNTILSNKKYRDFRVLLSEVHTEKFGRTKKPKILFYRFAAAASFLLIVVSSFLLWQSHIETQEKNELFTSYYAEMITLQSNDVENQHLAKAVDFYRNKDFKKAIAIFSTIANTDTVNPSINFYLALAYLGDENYTESERLLNATIDDNESSFVENAEWYLGVIYYQTKQYKKALHIFNTISQNPNHYKHDEALEAVKYINKEIP